MTRTEHRSRDELLTAREAAAMLKISVPALYAMKRRGQLPALRLGRRIRFRLGDLEAALEPAPASRGGAESR